MLSQNSKYTAVQCWFVRLKLIIELYFMQFHLANYDGKECNSATYADDKV